jgi:hypothetical protein
MGKAKNGILGPVSGKVGNVIFYVLNGEACMRTLGTRQAPLTPDELVSTSKMTSVMNFFKPIKPFIKLGFGTGLQHSNHNYHNAATSYNRRYAVTLIDGKPEIAFDRARVSSGTGLEPEQPRVELIENDLHFSWAHREDLDWEAGADQVMMMAYFPEDNLAIYETAGAKRKTGQDTLSLHSFLSTKRMELYISFITQDRKNVSNSVYLGRLN